MMQINEKETIMSDINNLYKMIKSETSQQKLIHPVATVNMLMHFDPSLNHTFLSVMPWLEQQESGTISMIDIAKQVLKNYGVPEDKLVQTIEMIKSL